MVKKKLFQIKEKNMGDRNRRARIDPRFFRSEDEKKDRVMFNYKEDSKHPDSNQRQFVSEEGYEYRDTRPVRRDAAMKADKRGSAPKRLDELDGDHAYGEHAYQDFHLNAKDLSEFERGFQERLVNKNSKIASGIYGKKKFKGTSVERVRLSGLDQDATDLAGSFDGDDEFAGFPQELRRVFRTNKNCLPIACLLRPRVLKKKRKISLPPKNVRNHIWEMARHGMAHRKTWGRLGDDRLELLFQFTAILKGDDVEQVNSPLHTELEQMTENTVDQTVEARMLLHLHLELDKQATMDVEEVLDENDDNDNDDDDDDDNDEDDEDKEIADDEAQYMREEEGVEVGDNRKERQQGEEERMMNTYMYLFASFRFSME